MAPASFSLCGSQGTRGEPRGPGTAGEGVSTGFEAGGLDAPRRGPVEPDAKV